MKTHSNSKNTAIEFWRFVCALIIMIYHSYEFGILDYPFQYSGWLFVEFFFILSGYFITNHVRNQQNVERGGYYTLRKIKRIYPYVLMSVIWIYIVFWLNTPPTGKREVVNILENFILEISFLGSVTNIMALNGPVWYLSTMFLVMPIFIIIVNKKDLSDSISLVVPILFYTNTGMIYGFRSPIYDVVRAFCGMLLGVFVYELLPHIKLLSDKAGAKITAICRIGCLALPVFLSFYNAQNNWLLLFCFTLAIALCIQSNPQYPIAISNIFSFLGKTSTVLFLMQYPIIRTVQFAFRGATAEQQAFLYYTLSLIVSLSITFFVYFAKKLRYGRGE